MNRNSGEGRKGERAAAEQVATVESGDASKHKATIANKLQSLLCRQAKMHGICWQNIAQRLPSSRFALKFTKYKLHISSSDENDRYVGVKRRVRVGVGGVDGQRPEMGLPAALTVGEALNRKMRRIGLLSACVGENGVRVHASVPGGRLSQSIVLLRKRDGTYEIIRRRLNGFTGPVLPEKYPVSMPSLRTRTASACSPAVNCALFVYSIVNPL
ncbi:hypothetical protein B0H14DRAFT_2863619 [Mycena olivaceomarginata]|nr:hypothetical protein B0H14DRAFT_2863619 [Mycena olivaceomarginata]